MDRSQAPLSMGFSRQEHWSGLPFPPPGDLPDPRIEPKSPALQADSLPLSHQGSLLIFVKVFVEFVKDCLNEQRHKHTLTSASLSHTHMHGHTHLEHKHMYICTYTCVCIHPGFTGACYQRTSLCVCVYG